MRQFTQGKSRMHFKLSDFTEKEFEQRKKCLTIVLIKIDNFSNKILWFPIFLCIASPHFRGNYYVINNLVKYIIECDNNVMG